MPGIAVGPAALPTTVRFILGATIVSFFSAGAMLGQMLPLPEGRVVGGLLQDDGSAMLAITQGWAKEHEATSVLFWNSSESARTMTVPSERARSVRFAHGRIILTNCVSLPRFGSHCAWGYKIFAVNESGNAQLEWELDPRDESTWDGAWADISHDGTAWVTMGGDEKSRTFTLGRSSSPSVERTGTVLFDYAEPHMPEMGLPPVSYLDVDRGIVLTPWSGGAYIVSFRDGDVRSFPWLPHEPKATHWADREREVAWAAFTFSWQEDQGVLWAMKYDRDPEDPALWPGTTTGRTWRAYDFRDVESPAELPDRPFWTINVNAVTTSGRPHPHRGFVQITSGPTAYRIAHAWRGPDSDEPAESHVSDCQRGNPEGAAFVSSNGRHAIVIEGEASRPYARRIDLRPAPSAEGPIPDCDLDGSDSESLE